MEEIPSEIQPVIPLWASVEYLVDLFVQRHELSDSSRATYARELRQFSLWMRNTGRAERMGYLNEADLAAYREDLLSAGKAPNTIAGYLTVVRQFYDWLEQQRVYPDIANGVSNLRKTPGLRRDRLTIVEIQRLLGAIDQNTLEGSRDSALVNLLLASGAKAVQIAAITVADFDSSSSRARLRLVDHDGGEEYVGINLAVALIVKRYLDKRGKYSETDPLFCSISDRNYGHALTVRSISRIVKQALRRAGLDAPELTAISLRHTALAQRRYMPRRGQLDA